MRVLFLCTHNSARSQMAETFLNDFGAGKFEVQSAGINKSALNPYVIRAMAEIGYDISKNESNTAQEFYLEGRDYDLVVTVCDKEAAAQCPIFPSAKRTMNWSFADPAKFTGTDEEIMAKTREVRDLIKERVYSFANSPEEA